MFDIHLTISTGHLTKETVNGWAVAEEYPVIANYEYGLFVAVADATFVLSDFPADLATCIDYAKKHGASVIRFDRDADRIDELPFFEW